jgi:hypothetical protein
MPDRRQLAITVICGAALTWASVSLAAEPSIRVSGGASMDTLSAGVGRLGEKILTDVSAARNGVGESEIRYFDLNNPLGDIEGFDDLPSADRILMRGAKQTYDLFRALGGPRIDSFAVTATEDGRYYLSLDGEGGRWLATPGAALAALAGQLAEAQAALKGSAAGGGGGAHCPLDYTCLLKSLYSGAAPTIATVPRGTTVVLEMTGSDFSNKAGAPVIIIGDHMTPLDVTYVNPEAITARVSIDDSAPLGLQSMLVFNQDKQFGVQQRYKLRVVSDLAELESAVTGVSTDGSETLKGTGKVDALADDYANTKAEAAQLGAGLSGRIEVSGDTDLFRIDLAQNGSLSISSAGPTDLVAELRDDEGTLIARNDDGGPRYNFLLEAPVAAGTYYLQVTHCCNGKGSYSLNQTFQPL